MFDFQRYRNKSLNFQLYDTRTRIGQLRQQRQQLLKKNKSLLISWQSMKSEKIIDKYKKTYQEYGINRHVLTMQKQIKILKRKKEKYSKNIQLLKNVFDKNKIKIQQLKIALLKKAQSIQNTFS